MNSLDNVEILNIIDLVNAVGEIKVNERLGDFFCPQNEEIDVFLKKNAIEFAKRKMSITYLVLDKSDAEILAYFTLTHKAIEVSNDGLSNTSRRKLSAHSRLDSSNNTYNISAFLLAQFGKNYAVDGGKRISGKDLMDLANGVLADIQHRIGGGFVYLDCENNPFLIHFYEDIAGYKRFGERYSDADGIKYLQYMRFL